MLRPKIFPEIGTIQHTNCDVHIGTCGYSYTEWIDSGFYPTGIKNSEMLQQYAYLFGAVELNYTWYQMAREDAIQRQVDKSPSNFLFTAKLTRSLTHERADNWLEQVKLYKKGIAPLRPQLLAILIQFPLEFDRSLDNRYYLAKLLDELNDYPVAIEFRNASWASDAVFMGLEKRRVTLVTVDEPDLPELFPCLDVVTNKDLFYVKFHGRNAMGWNSSNMQKKFDYNYSQTELHDWYENHLKKMISQSKRGVIFFNNHVRAQAPDNAKQMAKIIQSSR